MREFQDNIITILKSIPRIKFNYSKQNKHLDKTFKNKSLGNLLKNLDYHPKLHDEYAPSPDFLNHRNQYDINFQNSDNYIKEYSDLNNLPLVINNRNYLKNGDFNPDYELNPVKNKEEQNIMNIEREKRKKERLKERLEKLKKWRQSDSNIDPGKYHPNYDYIRKKVACVYIRQPAKKQEINENNKNKSNKSKEKRKKDNHNNSKDKNSNNNSKDNIKEESKEDNNKSNINNKDYKDNNNNSTTNCNDSHTINNSSINNKSSKVSISGNLKLKNNYKKENLIEKNSSTNTDYNNSIDLNKSTNTEYISSLNNENNKINKNSVSLPKIDSKKIKIRNIKPRKKYNRFRSSSMGNLKNSIHFKKMLGRDDLLFGNLNLNLISYFPNYDIMMPHIPSTIFKYKKNPQNYKKYVTGKIIRGYNYSPEQYFVEEYAKNKIKKVNLYKERQKIKEILSKKVL